MPLFAEIFKLVRRHVVAMPMNFNSVIEEFNVFKNEPVDMVMVSEKRKIYSIPDILMVSGLM